MSASLDEDSIVRLPRGVRLRHDQARGGWVLLAPERVFQLDAIAHAVVERVDGERSVAAIIDDLATSFEAERERIHDDVLALFRSLIDKGIMEVA
ncbi:pyrroloquinoline quinone biosynthesis peptide chaperone PqqD [Kushneria phosphatilytica]|uniref:PqqA binding protein n=1 Tax=Kushneria phosphatilytica TaxID=657387 RepID=A0A1S1NUU2_9GAMM|nr:pyrroloquinoline quinone biosynthesis peptide chaperone PqqD [Kushneria phosphatilytica]OHV13953.1 pyrroloquinoline quinone biosynthesis protein PqqD [Kushneria phosphatilytica]QEL10515.1 pyrroloquinoline quinone biosynthesis peptide chaperone PqqD [Kushneria phosphatilytica]